MEGKRNRIKEKETENKGKGTKGWKTCSMGLKEGRRSWKRIGNSKIFIEVQQAVVETVQLSTSPTYNHQQSAN